MDLEHIIEHIKNLPLKEVLAYLASLKLKDLPRELKKIIQDKFNEGKYGFVPNPIEADILQKISNRHQFREFKHIIPNSKYEDAIRVGYLITRLTKTQTRNNDNVIRIREIKDELRQRHNGYFLIRATTMVTTGTIVPAIEYLSELKRKGYDKENLDLEFEKMLNDWDDITLFVTRENDVDELIGIIDTKLSKEDRKILIIYAYGRAKYIATKAVAGILNSDVAEDYFYESKNNDEGEKEVHTSTFTKISKYTKHYNI